MTEEERARLTTAKAEVTEDLAAWRHERYRLAAVDARLDAYVREVAGNPAGHNLWEQLAVRRFFGMIDKYGLNVSVIRRFFTLYESLYLPGKRGHRRYELTPVQTFQFAHVYGLWDGGRRVVRECCLYVPRKFSKTTESAAFALNDLLYGDANAEVYIGANSQDQAKKCFDVIRGCMSRLDPGGRRYIINEEVIKSRRRDRSAFAQCLTANARTKDGLNASTVIMDEFSQARDNELLTVLTTSMGVRENPLTVIITTASDIFEGPFYSMLQGYKALLLGDYDDDSVFAHLFEPDIDDPEDSANTWRKVHPHMGVTVSEHFYRQEYKNAVRNGADAMLAFRTKLLNVYAENEQRAWISATQAKAAAVDMGWETFADMPGAMAAIDLSESDDFSAVSFGTYDKATQIFRYRTDYFFPEDALAGHPNERLYRKWAEAGHLHLTPGPVISYSAIVEHVLKISRHVHLVRIGYDPYKSREIVNTLATIGNAAAVVPVRQSYGEFNAAVEFFEHCFKTGHAKINDNPINYFCFGNAVLDYDKLENCKPIKRSHNMKIDGVITMLMCQKMFLDSYT